MYNFQCNPMANNVCVCVCNLHISCQIWSASNLFRFICFAYADFVVCSYFDVSMCMCVRIIHFQIADHELEANIKSLISGRPATKPQFTASKAPNNLRKMTADRYWLWLTMSVKQKNK